MSVSTPDSWRIFVDQYPQFMKLTRKLSGTDWYSGEGWSMFIGHYHAGIYAQISKANWHNYGLDGVHIEAGLTAESLAEKRIRWDLHIGHANLFDRHRFNELTLDAMEALVSEWGDGYVFSRKNLSDRLHTHIPFTKSKFAEQMTLELTRWSALAPIIDNGLAQLQRQA